MSVEIDNGENVVDLTKATNIVLDRMEYEFYAAIEHDSNHFVSYVKRPANNWQKFDDLNPARVTMLIEPPTINCVMVFYRMTGQQAEPPTKRICLSDDVTN